MVVEPLRVGVSADSLFEWFVLRTKHYRTWTEGGRCRLNGIHADPADYSVRIDGFDEDARADERVVKGAVLFLIQPDESDRACARLSASAADGFYGYLRLILDELADEWEDVRRQLHRAAPGPDGEGAGGEVGEQAAPDPSLEHRAKIVADYWALKETEGIAISAYLARLMGKGVAIDARTLFRWRHDPKVKSRATELRKAE